MYIHCTIYSHVYHIVSLSVQIKIKVWIICSKFYHSFLCIQFFISTTVDDQILLRLLFTQSKRDWFRDRSTRLERFVDIALSLFYFLMVYFVCHFMMNGSMDLLLLYGRWVTCKLVDLHTSSQIFCFIIWIKQASVRFTFIVGPLGNKVIWVEYNL